MSVATSARNGAINVPVTTLSTKLRRNCGRRTRTKPSTMLNAIRIRNTRTYVPKTRHA
jgi:hypothetical protein